MKQSCSPKLLLLCICAVYMMQGATSALDKAFLKDFVKVSAEFEAAMRDIKNDFKSRALSQTHAENLSKILRGVKDTVLHIPKTLFEDPFVQHALKRVKKVVENVVSYFALDSTSIDKVNEAAAALKLVSTEMLKVVVQELMELYAAITQRIPLESIDDLIKSYIKAVREHGPSEFVAQHYSKIFRGGNDKSKSEL